MPPGLRCRAISCICAAKNSRSPQAFHINNVQFAFHGLTVQRVSIPKPRSLSANQKSVDLFPKCVHDAAVAAKAFTLLMRCSSPTIVSRLSGTSLTDAHSLDRPRPARPSRLRSRLSCPLLPPRLQPELDQPAHCSDQISMFATMRVAPLEDLANPDPYRTFSRVPSTLVRGGAVDLLFSQSQDRRPRVSS